MKKEEIIKIVEEQRKYFNKGETISVSFRIEMLKRLKIFILKYEQEVKQKVICVRLA